MEPETASLRLWWPKPECLRINFDGICCEPSGTVKSQEQNVTNERNEDQEADTNLTRVDSLLSTFTPDGFPFTSDTADRQSPTAESRR